MPASSTAANATAAAAASSEAPRGIIAPVLRRAAQAWYTPAASTCAGDLVCKAVACCACSAGQCVVRRLQHLHCIPSQHATVRSSPAQQKIRLPPRSSVRWGAKYLAVRMLRQRLARQAREMAARLRVPQPPLCPRGSGPSRRQLLHAQEQLAYLTNVMLALTRHSTVSWKPRLSTA